MASYNEKQEDLQPFLRSSVDSLVEEEEIQHRSNPARLRSLLPVLSHIVLIGIYTMVSVVLIRRASSNQSPSRNLVYCECFGLIHLFLVILDIKSNESQLPLRKHIILKHKFLMPVG